MQISTHDISIKIKEYAHQLGFDACGFCKAENIGTEEEHLKQWVAQGYHADMDYLNRNTDKRSNPQLLVEGAKSIISVALNYYPPKTQPIENPQFAYYAYGKDYHKVVKDKLELLYKYIQSIHPETVGRYFCDTAPVMERYWATKAGIGFIGKNSLLIIPKKGSFFFLGEIILNIDLNYDKPIEISCGSCTRCIDACPTKAIESAYILNSNNCISYQTIENRGEIKKSILSKLNNNVYGCDICQKVCPWNKYAIPCTTEEFFISNQLLNITHNQLKTLTIDEYQQFFKGSAVKRAKLDGLQRNIKALEEAKNMK